MLRLMVRPDGVNGWAFACTRCLWGREDEARSASPETQPGKVRGMSFSFTLPPANVDQLADTARAAADDYQNSYPDQAVTAERGELIDAALEAVALFAGTVGAGYGPDRQLAGSISGHANPGHAATEGFGDEQVQVSLYVLAPAAGEQPTDPGVATTAATEGGPNTAVVDGTVAGGDAEAQQHAADVAAQPADPGTAGPGTAGPA